VTGFVVLTSPRSGSGWLIDLLNSHPAIVAYPELFHTERRTAPDYGAQDLPYFEADLRSGTSPIRRLTTLAAVCCKRSPVRIARQAAYLVRVYASRPGARAGFKLTYVQSAANPALLPLFSLRRVRAVHLVRANQLAAVISWRIARESGIYHARREATQRGRLQQTVASELVLVDAEHLLSELERRELAVARMRRRLERLRLPRLEIAYEELVGHTDATLARVLRFLGFEPDVDLLQSELRRAHTGPPLDQLVNPDEVRATLAGTRFEWMLEQAA
jgi:LPS sulfotransferase NodH